MKPIYLITIAIVIAVAVGAALLFATITGRSSTDTAEAAIRADMKDPDSVLFKGVFEDKPSKTVCGFYNAKNGYGAYTGYSAFGYSIDDREWFPMDRVGINQLTEHLDTKEAIAASKQKIEAFGRFINRKPPPCGMKG